MKKVKFLKLCGVYNPGEITEVGNNEAFGLIESGYAQPYQEPKVYASKELRASRGKKYKTK